MPSWRWAGGPVGRWVVVTVKPGEDDDGLVVSLFLFDDVRAGLVCSDKNNYSFCATHTHTHTHTHSHTHTHTLTHYQRVTFCWNNEGSHTAQC